MAKKTTESKQTTKFTSGTRVRNTKRTSVGKLLGVSVEGQTGDKRQQSPKKPGLFSRLVGCSNVSPIFINNIETVALIDSGSQITTICDEFYMSMNPKPELRSIEDFELSIEAAGGYKVPYAGYIWCTVEVPFLPSQKLEVPALIVTSSEYSLQVPIIIGTNVIDLCHEISQGAKDIPKEWRNAFISSQQSMVGVVKSTNKAEIKVNPFETVTVSGFVRKSRNVDSVITEQTPGATTRIDVCPRVLSLNKVGKSQRVPIRICNMSAKQINIKPNSDICELHEIKVLRHLDLDAGENVTKVHQHKLSIEKVNLPEGINLDQANITEQQKEHLLKFSTDWRDIFSKDAKDLGKCDLTKHQINLNDETPFKEPARRIPPAIFEEIREHLLEMTEAGAVRESKSSYSSNAVIVRKKDGSIRFCVDFRKLNNKQSKMLMQFPEQKSPYTFLPAPNMFRS